MARNRTKNNHKQEPWSRKFDEQDEFSDGGYSRTARKKAREEISPILKTLFIFLVLLFVLPLSIIIWGRYNTPDSAEMEPDNNNVVINQSNSSEEEVSSEEDSSEDSAEENETSSEPESTEEEPEEETTQEPEETEVVTEEPQETETVEQSEPPAGESTNTYVVQPGDNLYRIALNHGMSTEELKSLNGLTGDTVNAGTVLKVR